MRIIAIALFALLGSCGSSPMGSTDMSMSVADAGDGGGTKMFGDQCFTPGNPGDCGPGLICDMFVMNTINRCTRMCDVNPNPTNCPAPSNGTCNGKGECKFTQ
jgi:hypothetical protein